MHQFDGLATPMWVFDVERHCLWWANRPGLAFWQADSVDALCARDFSSDSPTVRKRLRQVLQRVPGQGRIEETWTLYPADRRCAVVLAFQPVRLGAPARDGVLVELVRHLEQPADDSSWRMIEATRASSRLISMFSVSGELLVQNPASFACYGPSKHKTGPDLAARLPDGAVWRSILARVLEGEHITWEVTVQTAKGARIHSISATKGRDPITGEFVAILSEEDVTELAVLRERIEDANRALEVKVAERTAELRQSQERYRLAAETAAIWDWDVPRDDVFVSPNFLQILGYEPDAHQGQTSSTFLRFVYPDDREVFRRACDRHLTGSEPVAAGELRFLQKNGEPRWFELQGKCIIDPDGTPIRSVGLITDITRRKELEATLMAAQRLDAVGQLTGGIAHDFNNLLTVIQGNAQLLDVVGQPEAELISEIEAAVGRGAQLTRHLLAFAGKQTLVPQSVRLPDLLETMRKTLFRVLSEAIEIEIATPEDLWPVFADPTQIEAALLNLALNASAAMPQGGRLTITCTNRPLAEQRGIRNKGHRPTDLIEIAVGDTGTGMPPDVRDRAFEPFFTTKPVGSGSGLGLSMVLGFSRQSGGDTHIRSQLGEGTTVSVFLPRRDSGDARILGTGLSGLCFGDGEHIHVVEDDEIVLRTVIKSLVSLGYRVSTSREVSSARKAARGPDAPDLFLLDVVLPGGESGADFARELKAQTPRIPYILMSGYSHGQLFDGPGKNWAEPILAKPFDRGTISRAVRAALRTTPESQ